jgi:hypothetical protein
MHGRDQERLRILLELEAAHNQTRAMQAELQQIKILFLRSRNAKTGIV